MRGAVLIISSIELAAIAIMLEIGVELSSIGGGFWGVMGLLRRRLKPAPGHCGGLASLVLVSFPAAPRPSRG